MAAAIDLRVESRRAGCDAYGALETVALNAEPPELTISVPLPLTMAFKCGSAGADDLGAAAGDAG
jgi:hypothetical protein